MSKFWNAKNVYKDIVNFNNQISIRKERTRKMAEPISVLTTSGKILTVKPGDDIDALVKNGTINKEQATAIGKMLKSESPDLNQGITVEAGTQGTQADRAARAAAQLHLNHKQIKCKKNLKQKILANMQQIPQY